VHQGERVGGMSAHASGVGHCIALLRRRRRVDFRLGATFQHVTVAVRIRSDF
jgi:hypothetical protein